MFDPVLYHGDIDGYFHVVFALKLSQYLDTNRHNKANLLLFTSNRSMRTVYGVDHIGSRISVEFYIDFREREKMFELIKHDVETRKLWPNRIEEYNEIVNKFIDPETLSDGFGNSWSAICPMCKHKSMQIVRPGEVQCTNCI